VLERKKIESSFLKLMLIPDLLEERFSAAKLVFCPGSPLLLKYGAAEYP